METHTNIILTFLVVLLCTCTRDRVNPHLPQLHLSLQEGQYELLIADKSYKARGQMALLSPDGDTLLCQPIKSLKGRGNHTWTLPKKPFRLTLHQPESLLSLGPSKRFYLLANAFDPSGLRNAVALDISREFMLAGAEYEFVSLFIDGKHQGIYQLVNADTQQQSPLPLDNHHCLLYLSGYKTDADFISQAHVAVEIKHPKKLDSTALQRITDTYNRYEQALISPTGYLTDSTYYANGFDLQSFATYYLLQEVLLNQDAGAGSVYLCLADTPATRFYAGALWDFDISMGNPKANPTCQLHNIIWAANARKVPEGYSGGLMHLLCSHNDFKQQVEQTYTSQFSQTLLHTIDSTITRHLQWITDKQQKKEVERLSRFLHQRLQYTDWLYLNDQPKICLNATFNHGILDNKNVQIYIPADTTLCLPIPPTSKLQYSRWYFSSGQKVPQPYTFSNDTTIILRHYNINTIKRFFRH